MSKLPITFALLCSTAVAQATIPPGVPASQRQLTPFTAGLLSGEVGYGGAVYGLKVQTPTGWCLISTPADVRPQAQSEDGGCQFCAAAAIAATATVPEHRSIVQSWQATAVQRGTTWMPDNSRCRAMDSLGAVGTSTGWQSWWELWDSTQGSAGLSPLWMWQRLSTVSETGRTWLHADATFYRMSGLPQFTYERWNAPYLVLDGRQVLYLSIDDVRTPISAVPVGTTASPPAWVVPVADEVEIGLVCGRRLLVSGSHWSGVRFWRPHPAVLIVTGIVSGKPCAAGQPVSLWWELEAQ